MHASVLLNFIKRVRGMSSNARLYQSFYCLFTMSLINSIIQEHKCEILYII